MKNSHIVIRSKLLLILLVTAFDLGAWGQTSDTQPADEARIRQASEDWGRAALNRDLEKTVSYYADDASYLPPGAPIVVGKDAIRKAWANFLAIPGITLKTTTKKVDVGRSGDLAYEIGAWDMTLNDKDGKPVNSKGKYVVVWKKQPSGEWKAVLDMENTDQ
jgi:uncharacterized protein (TIGR02246 family)